jgi:hypothetical protein
VTRDLDFSILTRRTAPFNRLLRHAWGCGGPILTRILTGLEKIFKLDVSSTPRMPPHSAQVLKPCLILSNFKGNNCQKSLDCNFNLIKVKEWKLKISYFFVISRGITVKINAHSYDVSTHAISTLYMNPNDPHWLISERK